MMNAETGGMITDQSVIFSIWLATSQQLFITDTAIEMQLVESNLWLVSKSLMTVATEQGLVGV